MSSTATLSDLILLGRNRWAAPLLADLAAHDGARFVELLHRLGVARDSLARTLEATQAAGWVMRNPGHGHPLRPEYLLTEEGARLALVAGRVLAAQDGLGLAPGGLTRWGLPIVRSIDEGHRRFNDLARALPPASPRALSQGLRALGANRLVLRELVDGYPPASSYRLTEAGLLLARAA